MDIRAEGGQVKYQSRKKRGGSCGAWWGDIEGQGRRAAHIRTGKSIKWEGRRERLAEGRDKQVSKIKKPHK